MSVSQRLKKSRKHLELSKEKFARLLDVSLSTVNNYEGGDSFPTTRELDKLKIAIPNLDVTWLLTGDGEMFLKDKLQTDDLDYDRHSDIVEEIKRLKKEMKILREEMDELKKQ